MQPDPQSQAQVTLPLLLTQVNRWKGIFFLSLISFSNPVEKLIKKKLEVLDVTKTALPRTQGVGSVCGKEGYSDCP